MSNVNYRGDPSQDPNAPPESGVTSIPLGAPWPPLSREQVVKLHEGLRTFAESFWEGYKADETHYAWADAAEGLFKVLDALNLTPRPPPTRTWTHEEIAKVAEGVQTFTDSQSDMDCILAMSAPGRTPVLATMEDRFGHITDLSRHSKPREEPTTDEDSGPGAMSWQQAEEFGSPFAAAVEPAWLRLDWGSVQMPVRNLSEQGLAEGQMVTTAQVQVEPPKRNCWTCKHDFGFGHTDARYCRAMPARKRGERDSERHKAIGAWTNAQSLDATLMPPKDSDGCPGWERKP